MHSGFLAHIEFVSSHCARPHAKAHVGGVSRNHVPYVPYRATDLLTPMDAPTTTGCSDRWVGCLKS